MAEIIITDSIEIFSPDPARIGRKDTLITYTVDKMRTYMITLPTEEATPDRIMEVIRKAEQERGRIIGQTFEV